MTDGYDRYDRHDGKFQTAVCPNCGGHRQVCRKCGRTWVPGMDAPRCNGDGRHDWIDCPECEGVGEV
jgi:DnaJ-class molecular chaperone